MSREGIAADKALKQNANSGGSPKSQTLADVLDAIQADETLSPTRRRDLCSALRRFAELTGRPLERLPARLTDLKPALEAIRPVQASLSAKSWQNLRSNLKAALLARGAPGNGHTPLAPAWQALASRLPEKRLRDGLSRFLRYCSDQGTASSAVSDAVVDKFVEHLRTRTFLTDRQIRDRHRQTCRIWNEAAGRVSDWPRIELSVPDYRAPRRSIPLSEFPTSFRSDVEAYLRRLFDPDPFAEDGPRKPLKPKTVTLRRKQVELAASALVLGGREISSMTSLEDLVTYEAVKKILIYYRAEDGKFRVFARGLAQALISIAKEWVRVEPENLDRLRNLRRRLGSQASGLTEKNRTTLRQFESETNLSHLLSLPERLFQEALGLPAGDRRAAVRAQIALALEMLLSTPLRMDNLINLRFDRHIVQPGGNRGPLLLAIPGEEVKNGEPLEFVLKERLVRMISRYRRQFWIPPPAGGPEWIFTTANGGRKAQATLAQQIAQTVERHTGVVITPHQFRHLAGKIILGAQPGNLEAVRRLLGHRSIRTTSQFYATLDTRAAGEIYDTLLEQRREAARISGKVPRKAHKGRKVT